MSSTDTFRDADPGSEPGSEPSSAPGSEPGAGSGSASGSDPRDLSPQYVLPLVVRVEKDAPPAHTDALEAAGRAVLALLTDDRTTREDGEWRAAVEAWEDARIRKVVRRARGAEWRRAAALPGLTVTGSAQVNPAEVRVYPPIPLDGWPKELSKLQVSGTELDDPAAPAPPEPGTPVLWLSPEVAMSTGKAMAQAGHAAQLAWWALPDPERERWAADGFPLAVRTPGRALWSRLLASGLPVVRDAGFTEIAPGSATVVADHPGLAAHHHGG